MQVLKDEMREDIESAAMEEFLNNGFEKASMRGIASKIGITPGNIYRYFESKEQLFRSIVRPAYDRVVHLIKNDRSKEKNYDFSDTIEEFNKICKTHRKQLCILIDGGKGTSYQNIKSEITEMVSQKVRQDLTEGMDSTSGKENKSRSLLTTQDMDFMIQLYASGIVEGVILILREYPENRDMDHILETYLYMEIYKWNAVINDGLDRRTNSEG